MHTIQDPQFGDKMVTLMAALVLVLQIAMVAQRWIVTNIRIFAAQSRASSSLARWVALPTPQCRTTGGKLPPNGAAA